MKKGWPSWESENGRGPIWQMIGDETLPPSQVKTHWPLWLDELNSKEEGSEDVLWQEKDNKLINSDEYFASLHSIF